MPPYSHHSLPPESDTGTEPAADELLNLARQVEAWREGRGLSQNQLCRQIGGLNSKTHGLLVRGQVDELRPENHLPKYRAALLEIDAFDLRQEAEPILPDLPPTRLVTNAISSLVLNRGMDRFVLIEGESGAGKSTALRHVHALHPDSMLVGAHEGWASPCAAMEELLKASGFRGKIPAGFSPMLAAFKERMQAKPRLLLLDEGHHMEYRLLNVVKEVINSTAGWVGVATMASLWRKIQSAKWSEVKQLIHNRMHLRVVLPAPKAADVEFFLTPRLNLNLPAEKSAEATRWDRSFEAVAASARTHGLYAYCRKAANTARLVSMKADRPGQIQPDDLFTAAAAVAANTEGFDR